MMSNLVYIFIAVLFIALSVMTGVIIQLEVENNHLHKNSLVCPACPAILVPTSTIKCAPNVIIKEVYSTSTKPEYSYTIDKECSKYDFFIKTKDEQINLLEAKIDYLELICN